jgi:altronate dehydratase small subunit
VRGVVLDDVGLLLDAADTVATAVVDLAAGREVSLAGAPDDREFDAGAVVLADDVPFGHKFALVPHAPGDPVYKYGERIGRATDAVAPGEWVHTHNCESTRGRGDRARADGAAAPAGNGGGGREGSE